MREALLRAVPGRDEVIRYDIAAVMLGGRYAIQCAGLRHGAGLYPVPVLDTELEEEVAPLRSGKDSVLLQHRQPLPVELVERVSRAIMARRTAST